MLDPWLLEWPAEGNISNPTPEPVNIYVQGPYRYPDTKNIGLGGFLGGRGVKVVTTLRFAHMHFLILYFTNHKVKIKYNVKSKNLQ